MTPSSVQPPVVHGKLLPPVLARHTISRARITDVLLAPGARLTLVTAGAGFGKSTALAALDARLPRLAWCHLESADADPRRLLHHLLRAYDRIAPGVAAAPLALLERWEGDPTEQGAVAIVDALVNALFDLDDPPHLVLEDAHLLSQAPAAMRLLGRLITHMPPASRLWLSSRAPLSLPVIARWRLQGWVHRLQQSELAFTPGECEAVMARHGTPPLTGTQIELLHEKTGGWPVVVSLVAQRIAQGVPPDQALEQLVGHGDALLSFLMDEVLRQLPDTARRFLQRTAVLRQLTPALCDALTDGDDSRATLRFLQENSLFVTPLAPDVFRTHPLFRELLLARLDIQERQQRHRQAAAWFEHADLFEEAIDHCLAAEAHDDTVRLLVDRGHQFIQRGRLALMQRWLLALPPERLPDAPLLLVFLGDLARLQSRFDVAIGWYDQAIAAFRTRGDRAGLGKALRGKARIFLDTINPSRAEELLGEALRLADGTDDRESQARLLDLLAENLLNQGRLAEVEQYRAQARALREEGPGEAELQVRVLLRTGRLSEVARILHERVVEEAANPVLRPRSHRETQLLLAITAAMQGDADLAHRTALEGTRRGKELNSPFITAVGYMRQGGAWLLSKDDAGYERAQALFETAIALSDTLEVPRLKVEAYWGLTQAYGFRGHVAQAQAAAEAGLRLAAQAGDEWIAAGINLTVGAMHLLADHPEEARSWLERAGTIFAECADSYGLALTRLWQSLLWYRQQDSARLERDLRELLRLVADHGYGYLFTRRTLVGPPDPSQLVPLLIAGRALDPTAQALLEQLDLSQIAYHPGFRLQAKTLGAFRIWQGPAELPGSAWRRQKARELFQLFLTYHHTLLHREQLMEMLWPEASLDEAQRNFKATYSTLCRTLEPDRRRNQPSAFIVRVDSRYGLRAEADIDYDVATFDTLIANGDRLARTDSESAQAIYAQALDLYQGDFLQEYPYLSWADQERRRLRNRFLRSAERLANLQLQASDWDGAIAVSNRMLTVDNCWEPAYRLLMHAYAGSGNAGAAVRAFQRCVSVLQDELGVAPSADTIAARRALGQPTP